MLRMHACERITRLQEQVKDGQDQLAKVNLLNGREKLAGEDLIDRAMTRIESLQAQVQQLSATRNQSPRQTVGNETVVKATNRDLVRLSNLQKEMQKIQQSSQHISQYLNERVQSTIKQQGHQIKGLGNSKHAAAPKKRQRVELSGDESEHARQSVRRKVQLEALRHVKSNEDGEDDGEDEDSDEDQEENSEEEEEEEEANLGMDMRRRA